ncbi:MFS transporter [Erwiniaceae bacterium BAC15a-03b]|uniref:MFS transporter n=1 Tax=Winslowiella arboricola TaxID=2978220 RepID=A0A9J6PN81_9GAMM|nr:MFS transporter [Winslowiella arboricola]MCU5772861.1 MFS transporter [Winslowiella arboricola]MCU5777165.1 MFS transporter [Winslowiella arboricola]
MNGQPAAAPVPHPFTLRLALGLIGVLIAALTSGLNDRVTDIALADVRTALGISFDQGSWIIAVYQAAEVAAMMIAPWFAVTLSLRRFTLGVAIGFALIGALLPFATDLPLFITLRTLQGIFGGALPPMLMTVALRFLPPPIKLFGLSAYALTATFGPNMAASLASFWTDAVGWQFVFWQVLPPMLIAAVLISWGLPQDPTRFERFKQIDLFGMLTGCSGMALLIMALVQGERLDWFNSPLISAMLLSACALLLVFLINEWFHPLPLFRLQMLARKNLAHGLLVLAGVLTVALSGSALPSAYFAQVEGFRTLQFAPLALTIGLPQLIIAPLIAALLNLRWIDCRWVLTCGAALMAGSCLMGAQLTSEWARENFWLIQLMQAFGQPMMIIPVLMSATSVVLPPEGPFASAMFNTVRGFSSIAAGTLVECFLSHREKIHSHNLLDQAANRAWLMSAESSATASASAPLLPDGSISSSENIGHFSTLVKHQAMVLSISDSYLMLIGFAILLVLLTAWLPKRVWPPQTLIQPVTHTPGK